MKIKKKVIKGYVVISLKGDMEAYDAEKFEIDVLKIIKEGRLDIIIDFKALEYISSSGLRALLNIRERLNKEGKRLLLASLKGKVLEVFRVSRLLETFEVYKDVKDAMRR